MFKIDIDALKTFTCVSPYFVRDEEFTMYEDCMCMMLLDENMQPLPESRTEEFSEALNKAILDYCLATPFKADANSLYGKSFVPTPINDDTLEYSIMHILYMTTLKAEHFGYSGIAILVLEGRKHGQQYTVWHCLCAEKSGPCYSEVWMKSQRDKEGNVTYVNDEGEKVGVNEIAALLEEDLDFDDPIILDETLKKVLEKITF